MVTELELMELKLTVAASNLRVASDEFNKLHAQYVELIKLSRVLGDTRKHRRVIENEANKESR